MSEPGLGEGVHCTFDGSDGEAHCLSEDALGMKMTPMYKEDDLTRSDTDGMEVIASGWRFLQGLRNRAGWMTPSSSIRLKTL